MVVLLLLLDFGSVPVLKCLSSCGFCKLIDSEHFGRLGLTCEQDHNVCRFSVNMFAR